MKFKATTKEGDLIIQETDRFTQYIEKLGESDVILEVKKFKKQRSIPQNKYYWKVIVGTLSDKWGYTLDEIHDILKAECLRIPTDDHRKPFKVGSTTDLTPGEFMEYCSRCRHWASIEHQVYLPSENEYDTYS